MKFILPGIVSLLLADKAQGAENSQETNLLRGRVLPTVPGTTTPGSITTTEAGGRGGGRGRGRGDQGRGRGRGRG